MSEKNFFETGKIYFIRTVTMHLVGRIKDFTDKEILLSDASWVADSGRFHNALRDGTLNEVEPFVNDVMINRNCIIDLTEWSHKLPIEQK